jgi:CDP-paratose 2-epimerase
MGRTVSIILITGVGGLVGSEAAAYFGAQGHTIVGIDNDLRGQMFGASTRQRVRELIVLLGNRFDYHPIDIRSGLDMGRLFEEHGTDIALIVHTAAQPSHDFAATDPTLDWTVNADGTQRLLELARQYAPKAVFVFTSTNKVYGDTPNGLAYEELETRYEPVDPALRAAGFDEGTPVDASLHSLFGASKLAADVLVQEYGRYFGMNTVCFRGGCLTGAHHAGARLHGFLAYLITCLLEGTPYTIYGYGGKQVRDNLHARDLVKAFDAFWQVPRAGAVYNLGGGRANSVSVLEAIMRGEALTGRVLEYTISGEARRGDHQWWITDNRRFQTDYPGWRVEIGIEHIVEDMIAVRERAL